MTDERLKEIKNSIDNQYKEFAYISTSTLFKDRKELYNEVIRLRKKLATKKLFKKYKVQTPENFEIRKIFELENRIAKAIEYIEELIKPKRADTSFHHNPIYLIEMSNLLNILRGKDK